MLPITHARRNGLIVRGRVPDGTADARHVAHPVRSRRAHSLLARDGTSWLTRRRNVVRPAGAVAGSPELREKCDCLRVAPPMLLLLLLLLLFVPEGSRTVRWLKQRGLLRRRWRGGGRGGGRRRRHLLEQSHREACVAKLLRGCDRCCEAERVHAHAAREHALHELKCRAVLRAIDSGH